MKKFFLASIAAAILVFIPCKSEAAFGTDVVGAAAAASFSDMLGALPNPPEESDDEWFITSPGGAAVLAWRKNASLDRLWDVWISFNAAPFIAAGLDAGKLPEGVSAEETDGGVIITAGKKLSDKPLTYDGDITPAASFELIVKLDRESIGYHAPMDHFGVTVADGFVFEWAKDMPKNAKDIVFVVDPKIFIDAGVDPAKVEGWVYDKVPLEDSRGRKFEAEKFLLAFDLK